MVNQLNVNEKNGDYLSVIKDGGEKKLGVMHLNTFEKIIRWITNTYVFKSTNIKNIDQFILENPQAISSLTDKDAETVLNVVKKQTSLESVKVGILMLSKFPTEKKEDAKTSITTMIQNLVNKDKNFEKSKDFKELVQFIVDKDLNELPLIPENIRDQIKEEWILERAILNNPQIIVKCNDNALQKYIALINTESPSLENIKVGLTILTEFAFEFEDSPLARWRSENKEKVDTYKEAFKEMIGKWALQANPQNLNDLIEIMCERNALEFLREIPLEAHSKIDPFLKENKQIQNQLDLAIDKEKLANNMLKMKAFR